MKKTKYFRYVSWVLVAVIAVGVMLNYVYGQRIIEVCNNTQILARSSIGLNSKLAIDGNVQYISFGEETFDSRYMDSALKSVTIDEWKVYVPRDRNELQNTDEAFITQMPHKLSGEYYSHALDFTVWLSDYVSVSLWESYRSAIEYFVASSDVNCESASENQVGDLINVFSASTGDLFNISSIQTNYYIDIKERNILVLHEFENNKNTEPYYLGYLKAERGEKLINFSVKGIDRQQVYASLIRSSLEIK